MALIKISVCPVVCPATAISVCSRSLPTLSKNSAMGCPAFMCASKSFSICKDEPSMYALLPILVRFIPKAFMRSYSTERGILYCFSNPAIAILSISLIVWWSVWRLQRQITPNLQNVDGTGVLACETINATNPSASAKNCWGLDSTHISDNRVVIAMVTKNKKKQKQFVKTEIPFLMIPAGDRQLVRRFGLGLQDYWLDCWETDAYGSRWVLMADADLKSTTQAKYRKQLEDLGLFMFEIRKSGSDRKLWVLNLHGSRVKNFWKPIAQKLDSAEESVDNIEQSFDFIESSFDEIEQNKTEIKAQQEFQNLSTSSQEHLKNTSSTPQRSDEVLENLRVAMPQPLQEVVAATWDKEKAIEEVCEFAARCGYCPTLIQREELIYLTQAQFSAVKKGLNQLKKHSSVSKSDRFNHAVRLGRYAGA